MTRKGCSTPGSVVLWSCKQRFPATPVAIAVLSALYGTVSLANDTDLLEDVIVTATRHSVSAQDIPLSISAVSGAALEAAGIQDIACGRGLKTA